MPMAWFAVLPITSAVRFLALPIPLVKGLKVPGLHFDGRIRPVTGDHRKRASCCFCVFGILPAQCFFTDAVVRSKDAEGEAVCLGTGLVDGQGVDAGRAGDASGT